MRQEIIKKFADFCSNGHTPLSLQKLLKDNCESLNFTEDHMKWFNKYLHRIRDIVRSESGYQTMLGFKNNTTHTAYSLKKIYKKDSHTSYARWLLKLEEIKLLCRYDQEDGLEEWGKKKIYALNPEQKKIAKLILDIIWQVHFTTSI